LKIARRTFILGGAVTLLSYVYYQVHTLTVKRYTLPIEGLPKAFKGFTILHLTDLHSKFYGEQQEKLLALLEALDFHLVACTGDFVDEHNPDLTPTINLLQGIAKPIYYVYGNHDHHSQINLHEPLERLGIKILNNQGIKFDKDDEHFWLLGVDDPYLGRHRLDEALEGVKDNAPKVLLAHAPEIFPQAVEADIDVVLVGHTHGGQVRLPLIGALVVPGQGFFPYYDYGIFKEKKTTMVINGGLGESVLALRFLCPPEVVLVTLL